MSDEIKLEGLGVAPGVLDTIVAVATESVDGVVSVGASGLAGLVQKGARKGTARAVDVVTTEEGALCATVRIQVRHGYRLREVATAVQEAVIEALTSQVGVEVESVDVFVDGLVFDE